MAKLIVRDIKEELVEELELRASRNGHSAGPSFKEFLEQMPDVGTDEDFERIRDLGRPVDL